MSSSAITRTLPSVEWNLGVAMSDHSYAVSEIVATSTMA